MGHAIWAAFQDDEARGLQAWRCWALRWPGNPGNPEGNTEKGVEDDWDTFKPPYAIGARYLLNLARRHGFEEAGTYLIHERLEDVRDRARQETRAEVAAWREGDQRKAAHTLDWLRRNDPELYAEAAGILGLTVGWDAATVDRGGRNDLRPDPKGPERWTRGEILDGADELAEAFVQGRLERLPEVLGEWERAGTLPAPAA